jgi:hypothetical protein
VLETYNTTFNFWMNRGLFSVHCWLSWSFVFPYVTTLVHLVVALRAFVSTSFDSFPSCSIGLILASCVVGSTLVELCSLRHLSKVVINLCNALSPGTPHISIQSYNFFMVHLHLLLPLYRLCLADFVKTCQEITSWNHVMQWLIVSLTLWKVCMELPKQMCMDTSVSHGWDWSFWLRRCLFVHGCRYL